jgi:hypothetical protein
MLTQKGRLILVAFALLSLVSANAQADDDASPCFTLESLEGSYAVVGHYGANVAISLGTRVFDGDGGVTGTSIVNEPTPGSTTGARTIITAVQVGTYTVNCEGTGVITRTLTASNGVVTTQTDDFVITSGVSERSHRGEGNERLVATSMVDAQTVPSAIVAGGIFLTRTYTRLPPWTRPEE